MRFASKRSPRSKGAALAISARAPFELSGRTAIVIDDDLATGATMRAALRTFLKRAPKKIVLALPVAPLETIDEMHADADEIVCAVGGFSPNEQGRRYPGEPRRVVHQTERRKG